MSGPDGTDSSNGFDKPDPSLEIPEVLQRPVRKPDFDPVYGDQASRPQTPELGGAVKAWAIALDFVVTIITGAGLGWLADRWRNSLPLWTLVGLTFGFAAAFVRIVRATQRQERAEKARRDSVSRADK